MKELWKRIGVALWGVPLLVFLCYKGGPWFLFFVMVVNGAALWEFYSIHHDKSIHPYRRSGVLLSTAFLVGCYLWPPLWMPMLLLAGTGVLMVFLTQQKGTAGTNAAFSLAGILYISGGLSSLLFLREHFPAWMPTVDDGTGTAGGYFVIILFFSIWVCDTFAYLGGRMLGRHKLAPRISPNKTVEGGLSGLVMAVAGFVLMAAWLLPELTLGWGVLSGAIVGVFGQVGDLVESRFKRDAGVKDTSSLLPGHGGILDRFDSMIFVSPFFYALYSLFGTA